MFNPFSSSSYFHPYCPISNYNNQTNVEDCWLGDTTVSLPDLDTTQTAVQNIWYSWVTDLVANYSSTSAVDGIHYNFCSTAYTCPVDGLRIDTVKHVQKSFWPGYNKAAGVYCIGEVFDGDPAYACDYQNYVNGILNYPMSVFLSRLGCVRC